MAEFKIRRGLSTALFVDGIEGNINPKLKIEDGCWYLCTNTAALYLGVTKKDGSKDLMRINSEGTSEAISAIEAELRKIKDIRLYQQIDDEYSLPTDFTSADFNPNIVYYVQHKDEDGNSLDACSTYIYDAGTGHYLCTNTLNMSVVSAMVSDAITLQLDDKFTTMFESKFKDVLPNALQEVFAVYILHGGDAETD